MKFTDKSIKALKAKEKRYVLTEEGIIDSLDIVSLASYLEEKFGKEIDITDDNTLKAFSNFENIVKLVL